MTSTTNGTTVCVENFECRNLEQLLRKHFGNDFTVVEYKTDRLVPLGENFASIIIKIDVKAQRTMHSPIIEDFHFVGKTMLPPVGGAFYEKIDFGCVLNKEAFMYTNIIPMYAKVEKENGFTEKESIVNLVVQMYGHRLSLDPSATKADKDAIMLMENLKTQGYYVVDNKIGLDLEHAMRAIKALARFHALGIASRWKHSTEFKNIGIQANKPYFDFEIVINLYDKLVDYMRHEPRLAGYVDRVVPIIDRLRGAMRFEERTHELWSTIVHHDFWTNNIMFHRHTDRPDSVKFIDFQQYSFVDVFVDLSYFLCTSLNDEVTEKHFDELLTVYYGEFEFILKRFGVDVSGYSKKAFDERYRQVASYDLPRNLLAMIFFTAEIDNAENSNDVIAAIVNCKGNEQLFQKTLKILQIFEDRDWLP